MNIGAILSRAIKQGSWVYIAYKNGLDTTTFFWISILDVHVEDKSFKVDGFNYEISHDTKVFEKIYFNRIISAQIIEGTYYAQHIELVDKIDKDFISYEWLQYFDISDKVLTYYEQCYNQDIEVEENNFSLLSGFDEHQVEDNFTYRLNEQQRNILLKIFKHKIKVENDPLRPNYEKLVYSLLSIKTKSLGVIPIFYYDVKFDITNNELVLIKHVKFNPKFKTHESTYTLRRMIEADLDTLAIQFHERKKEVIEAIEQSLSKNELIDTRPYLIQFQKSILVPIGKDLIAIKGQYFKGELSRPLNAFFGRFGNVNRRKKRISNLILIDNKVNIEQLRAMFHAMQQDITYIQGPPGTGKTTLIKNVILSSLLNDRSVLVTSNNNEAINNIIRGLHLNQDQISLPYLRLGSIEYVEEALRTIQKLIKSYENTQFDVNRYNKVLEMSKVSVQELNKLLGKYEEKLELESQKEVLEQIVERNKNDLKFFKFKDDLNTIIQELLNFEEINNFKVMESVILSGQEALAKDFLTLETTRRLMKLKLPRYSWIKALANSTDSKRVQHFFEAIEDDEMMHQLTDIFPIIFTTNLGSRRLGTATPHFDLLIMDEAGQSAVATSLLPMARAERVMLVGDSSQLRPITQLDERTNLELMNAYGTPKTYDYANNSILKLMQTVDTTSPSIMLKEHYRSDKKIIGFSNKKYYDNQLIIKKKDQPEALKFIQVKSSPGQEKNTAYEEALLIARDIKKQNKSDVGVITPFKNQAALINKALAELNVSKAKVGTIHTFQGNENSTIYLSLGLTKQTSQFAFDWIKDNQELMNVATTRAKDRLIVVGDEEVIKTFNGKNESDLMELIQYTKKVGEYEVRESKISENHRLIGLKALNSKFENDFLDTLSHFLNIYGALKVKEKLKITDIFKISSEYQHFRYANTAHIDFVVFDLKNIPVLAIELNGNEHYNNQEVVARDKKKQIILEEFGLQLVSIPNHYARRYDHIRSTVIKFLGE